MMGDESSIPLQIRMPRQLVEQIDQQRQQQKLPPTRSQMIRYLIEKGLQTESRDAAKPLRRPVAS
jgi:Arc/MetJ-type ribon-helix-helix transcriptional regulator